MISPRNTSFYEEIFEVPGRGHRKGPSRGTTGKNSTQIPGGVNEREEVKTLPNLEVLRAAVTPNFRVRQQIHPQVARR